MMSTPTSPLLIALAVALYSLLAGVIGKKLSPRHIIPWAAGLLPFAVWLVWPSLLNVGAYGLSAILSNVGLSMAGIAVGLQYLAIRAGHRTDRQRFALTVTSGAAIVVGVVLATTNWLVGLGVGVSALATIGPLVSPPRNENQE